MRCFKSGVIFVLCVSFGLSVGAGGEASAGQAKTLRGLTGPAEFPPASFKGRQFADSRGCVFVRAGYGKTITWVPRVTRNRSQICGYKPTFVKHAPKIAAKQRPAPQKFAIRRASSATPKLAPKPVFAPKRVGHVKSGIGTASGGGHKAVVAAPIIVAAPPKASRPRRVAHVPSPAPAPTDFSMPKAAPAVVAAASAPKPWRFRLFAPRRIHPVAASAVVAQPLKTVAVVKPAGIASPPRFELPKGYKPAWTDGRLNPNRAVGTARGQAQMARIWTNTVPRRLIKGRPALGVITYAALTR